MPCERKPMRYGHSEGHTDVCFDDEGKCVVTCGSDGDVRIWESLDDDDPKSINVGEKVYSVALKVISAWLKMVENEGANFGILFSSDFIVKIVEVVDSSQQKTLRGHDAPILSVALDPSDEFLASSSCDGSVAVCRFYYNGKHVHNAKSLCRLAWQPRSGKLLAVPVDLTIQLYDRNTWTHVSTLSDDLISQVVNVVVWSPCGKFLAAGTVGGNLLVWDVEAKLCIERQKHEKGFTVCGMAWHPSGGRIAYTDTEGCLGLLEGVPSSSSTVQSTKVSRKTHDYDDLFDEDDDRGLDEGMSDSRSPVKKPIMEEDDDDDDLMPATGRPRNRGSFLDDDDNSQDPSCVKLDGVPEEDGSSAILPAVGPAVSRPVYEGPMPTQPQRAFQPGSTPVHLMHRFMVWNSVGIVRGYNDDQDNAIDVEFHDTAIHHAMHLTNTLGHTMADLSQEAVLLACEGTEELASKIQCLHFSCWDTHKDWIVDLPKGEDVRTLCLGQGWAAVATSALMVRLFSVGGVQKEIFSLPGAVVCMAGHGEQLLIVYHRGTGFDGDQALGIQLLQLGHKRRQVIHGEPLPLSRKSYLAWMGFTAEGTPCCIDSEGVVRMLNRTLGNMWTPVCNTRDSCKSKSDHYWVVGVHENPQQLRCIPCKGARYPPTLPRPAVAVLPFNLPYCQTTTEKGQMEEQYWRSVLFQNHYGFLSSSGYEIDSEGQSRAEKEQQELLMKMFALSCKLEREFRCVELAEIMTHSVVTLAIRYASRSRRMALAQRLSELALEKASQIQEEEQEEEEPAYQSGTNGPPLLSREGRVNPFKVRFSSSSPAGQPRTTNVLDSMTMSNRKPAPLGSTSKQGKAPVLKPLAPKPKSKVQCVAQIQMFSSPAGSHTLSDPIKLTLKAEKVKPAPAATPPASAENIENRKPKTGFQLWLEENRKSILADNPDFEEMDVIKEGMGRFRTLSAEERLNWTERAKGDSDPKKRKREDEEGQVDEQTESDEGRTKKKKPLDTSAKLSAFAFNKE
uniref:WD repeat and HMG-box DNA-binding protein 1 n=1 Tax=Cyprinus carpio TaxID=7962 RepID=A0A8C1IY41_CYPCA